MEKFVATAILLALLALVGIRANHAPTLSAAFAQMTEIPVALFGTQDDENQIANDTVPKPRNTRKIIREDDDQRVEAEYQDGRLTRLNVDGKEIPETEFDQHRDLTNELRRELRAPIAPIPPMPPGAFWVLPEVPAVAPMPPVSSRLSTVKDPDGNTIIKLERDGKPVEIRVKDGKVWIDGEELEEGESLEIPGFDNGFFYWHGDDDDTFHFAPEDGFHLKGLEHLEGLKYLENLDDFPHFQLSEEDRARLREEAERVHDEAARILEEHRQITKEQQRLRREELRLLEKEMKQHQKEWQKEQRRWQKDWAREQENLAREYARQAEQQEHWAKKQRQNTAFGKELKAELQRDGLIDDPSNFKFHLNPKELKVNGKKQSGELHRKYLELYESKTGKTLGDNGDFYWSESN